MRIRTGCGLVLGLALACFAFLGSAARTQTKSQAQKDYERLIYSVKGPDLYRAHCAACHGLDGKGGGPAAPSLKVKPPDLTLLAKSSGGKFPEARIRKVISGDEPSLLSHGSREMPIWGPIFHQIEADQDFGNVRLQNLIKYLESIQQN
jgi:mono/diheme cytochrome c family protein